MAGSTPAQLQTGFGLTVLWDGTDPVFKTGDTVYLRSDVVGKGAANEDFDRNPHTVINWHPVTAANGDLLDSLGGVASGVAAADVATDGTILDTNTLWATFYTLANDKTGKKTEVHESALLSVTGVNTLRDAEDWT